MEQEITGYVTVIKDEPVSDDEVQCEHCDKTFASAVALRNHSFMEHIDASSSGESRAWIKPEVPSPKIVKKNSLKGIPKEIGKQKQEIASSIEAASDSSANKTKKVTSIDSKVISKDAQKRRQEIIDSMEPTSLTSLAANNVSYIIVKSEDVSFDLVKNKKKKEVKVSKRSKSPQLFCGPFECLEASPLGVDGSCHQIFFSCCEYSAHARAEHSRRRRAARCQVCERPLATAIGTAAPYVCETCGEGFETTDGLLEHMSKTHIKVKPYECTVCHKRFTQQGGVVQHMRMHTGQRPFQCTFCSKCFTQKSGLEQHIRTHTKAKPYRCVVCAKRFTQSVHLKQHMRTHTQLAPFHCPFCNKRFKQSSHLNYHLRNHDPATMTEEEQETYARLVRVITEPQPVVEDETQTADMEKNWIKEAATTSKRGRGLRLIYDLTKKHPLRKAVDHSGCDDERSEQEH